MELTSDNFYKFVYSEEYNIKYDLEIDKLNNKYTLEEIREELREFDRLEIALKLWNDYGNNKRSLVFVSYWLDKWFKESCTLTHGR